MAELLLQSHRGEIHLLPALPAAWASGSVRGLRALGGYTVDIRWQAGTLVEAWIVADRSGPVRVRHRDRVDDRAAAAGRRISVSGRPSTPRPAP